MKLHFQQSHLRLLPSVLSAPAASFCLLSSAFCLLAFLLASANAEGGTISITSRVTLTVTGERLKGSLGVTNLGTATAHRVRAEVTLPWGALRTPAKTTLATGESVTFPLETEIEKVARGSHPVTILVRFQDERGYPFSALSCTTFSYREGRGGDLRCSAQPFTMTGDKGRVEFRLQNPGTRARAVRATLVLPRELSSPRNPVDLPIEGGSDTAVSFSVTNLSALQGASYPLFCFLEYDERDTHYTQICGTTLKVARGGNWFRKTRWYWAGGMAVLLGAFGLWRVSSSRRR